MRFSMYSLRISKLALYIYSFVFAFTYVYMRIQNRFSSDTHTLPHSHDASFCVFQATDLEAGHGRIPWHLNGFAICQWNLLFGDQGALAVENFKWIYAFWQVSTTDRHRIHSCIKIHLKAMHRCPCLLYCYNVGCSYQPQISCYVWIHTQWIFAAIQKISTILQRLFHII